MESINSFYKYYIFCCCRLPLQYFQFLLHSQLWEEYWWPIPRYKPSFINSIIEQSMAFPWTAFLCIPLPPTASTKGVQWFCLGVSLYLHLKVVLVFVLLSWSLQTQPAQIPSNACSNRTFDDFVVCYLLSQNVRIAWGWLQSGSTGKWKWILSFLHKSESISQHMHDGEVESCSFEEGAWGWWCQQGKHLGPIELQLMVVQCFSEDKHESCRSHSGGGIKNRVVGLQCTLWGLRELN